MKLLQRYNTKNIECALQFIVSETSFTLPMGFNQQTMNGTIVAVHRSQKITKVFDLKKNLIGVFLGTIVDLNKETIVVGDFVNETIQSANDIPVFLESYAGTYIFIFLKAKEKRIYLDADGTMSLVFDPVRKIAGSTAAVILDEPEYFARLSTKLFYELDVIKVGWFPSGLTAHLGIKRLLCNFYLDLSSWQCKRFWPIGALSTTEETQEQIDLICDSTRRVVSSLVKSYQVQQSLTAGNETRFLLACCREMVDRVSFFTVASTKIDMDIAQLLSKKFRLRHNVLPKIPSTERQQKEWLFRAGHSVGGINLVTHPSIKFFGQSTVLSIGLGGEVGRGFLWKNSDKASDTVTARLILGRFGLPLNEHLLKATALWLKTLPDGLDYFNILDLAYLELRMASWAYAQNYAQDAICLHISPMISYRNYKAMFAISPRSKKETPIMMSGIYNMWPELLSIPINRYGDYRDMVALVRKIASPARAIAKFRKVVSS